MAFAGFGPGTAYLTRTDLPNQTPVNVGSAQELSLDESADQIDNHGEEDYAEDNARGPIKATGKFKAARWSGIALHSVFHMNTFTAGQLLMAKREAGTVPAAAPYTVQVANHTVFDADLGVLDANTGLPLIKAAAAPAAGQYSVDATGTYTFAAADTGKAVLFTYAYSAAGGQQITVTAQPLGTSPTFQLDYATTFQGRTLYFRVFRCTSNKMARSFKLKDFSAPETDFSFTKDAAGRVYTASYAEVS